MRKEKIFLIDFLNIAYFNKHNGAPDLLNFNLVRKKLKSKVSRAKIFGIADPNSPFIINSKEEYEKLKDLGIIVQVGPGEKADFYMIKFAENKLHCCIITNDKFNDYKTSEELKERTIPVCIINGEVMFSEKLDVFMNNNTPSKCKRNPEN